MQLWQERAKELDIPFDEKYSIDKTLGEPLVLREWMLQGLPSDYISLENAIFIKKGYRWPLIVDP